MATETTALNAEYLTGLVEEGDRTRLRVVLNDQHPADLTEALQELDATSRLFCFRLLDLDNASAVLAEMDPDHQRNLLKGLGDIGVVPIVSAMSPDDAVDFLSELPEKEAKSIINRLGDDDAIGDIYELMAFKEDTAGGIMSTDYLAMPERMTVAEVMEMLRSQYEQVDEEIYDLFVIDGSAKLVGYLSVKDLLTAPPEALIESLMDRSFISVSLDTDQEEAAEKLSRYDLLSLPVVDSTGVLRGVITADDAMDVLAEEATEDMYQATGIGTNDGSETLSSSVRQAFRARLPWLIVTLVIESGSAMVITHFDAVIQQTVIAASFMPLLTSVTGSVAMQSTCIVIRNARKQWSMRMALRNVWHEMRVGMLLGAACGMLTTVVSAIFKMQSNLGLIVGTSLFITMSIGVLIGTLIPIAFDRVGIEPAHASGPLITSLLDVCTMTIYLSIVHAFLSMI
jgi:magnesium transporter